LLLPFFAFTSSFSATHAAQNDWYIGAGYGSSSVDTGITAVTASLDEEDTGFRLFAGLKLNKNISIEGFYADLGESSLTGNTGDTFIIDGVLYGFLVDNAAITAKAKVFGFNGLFALPLNDRFSLFGKLGLANWQYDATVSGSGIASGSFSDDGTDFFYGAGASYAINNDWSVRGEYNLYDFDGDDVDMLSINILRSF
jgi:OOP family OmpA-OmpF porin